MGWGGSSWLALAALRSRGARLGAPSGSACVMSPEGAAAVGAKTDALAIELLSKKYADPGITWELVASTVPPIRHAGT